MLIATSPSKRLIAIARIFFFSFSLERTINGGFLHISFRNATVEPPQTTSDTHRLPLVGRLQHHVRQRQTWQFFASSRNASFTEDTNGCFASMFEIAAKPSCYMPVKLNMIHQGYIKAFKHCELFYRLCCLGI